MTLVSLKCPNCAGDIELDDSREFGFCMYCGSKVMITKDVNNINIEMSIKDQRNNLKPLALAFCQRGEFSKAEEITKKLISANAADSDIWLIDSICELVKSGYFLDNVPEQVISPLEKSCVLSGANSSDALIEIANNYHDKLASKGDRNAK